MVSTDWVRQSPLELERPDGKVVVNAARQQLFGALGLDTVAAALDPGFGTMLRQLPDRANAAVRHGDDLLFVKRHEPGRPAQGMVEWDHTVQLARAGVPVAEPVCAGVSEEGHSFFITLGIHGEPLDDLLRRGRPQAPVLHEILVELADLTARLHASGFCHRDYYLCHVFVQLSETPGSRLALIDLQRVLATSRFRQERWRAKDLAALAYSAADLPLTTREKLSVLARYARNECWVTSPHASRRPVRDVSHRLLSRIETRVQRLLDRHGTPVAPPTRNV